MNCCLTLHSAKTKTNRFFGNFPPPARNAFKKITKDVTPLKQVQLLKTSPLISNHATHQTITSVISNELHCLVESTVCCPVLEEPFYFTQSLTQTVVGATCRQYQPDQATDVCEQLSCQPALCPVLSWIFQDCFAHDQVNSKTLESLRSCYYCLTP